MAVTSTGTLTSAMQTYYDNRFLAHFKERLAVIPIGQQRPIPMNAGKTVDFFRYHPYALVTASGTEGTVGTEVSTLAMNFTATLAVWKNYTKITEFLELTSRDRNLENIVDLMAQNAAESLEYTTLTELATYGATYVRGDTNASFNFEFTSKGSVITYGGTTALTSNTLATDALGGTNATDDLLIGAMLTITKGRNYGQSRLISDVDDSDTAVVWETAMPETNSVATIQAGTEEQHGWLCYFREHTLSTLASGGTGTTDRTQRQGFQLRAVFKAVEMLEKANAPKFPDGMYHGVIDPICKRQLLTDSDVTSYWQQSKPAKMEKNFLGEIGGVSWFSTTMPVRLNELKSAITNATFLNRTAGKLYITWVFGMNAFGAVELTGRQKKIIVKTPGASSMSTPVDEYSTVGWKAYFIPKALNSTYAVAIITYQA